MFLVYNNAINHFDQINHIVKGTPASVVTYSTFATFPAPYFHNVAGPLIDQIVGTFFLVLFVCGMGQSRVPRRLRQHQQLLLGTDRRAISRRRARGVRLRHLHPRHPNRATWPEKDKSHARRALGACTARERGVLRSLSSYHADVI